MNRLILENCLIVQLFHCLVFHRTIIYSPPPLLFSFFHSSGKFICFIRWKSVHSHICSFVVQTNRTMHRPQNLKYPDSDKKVAFVSHSGNVPICPLLSLTEQSRKKCIHVVFGSLQLFNVQCYSAPHRYQWKSKGKEKKTNSAFDWWNGSGE